MQKVWPIVFATKNRKQEGKSIYVCVLYTLMTNELGYIWNISKQFVWFAFLFTCSTFFNVTPIIKIFGSTIHLRYSHCACDTNDEYIVIFDECCSSIFIIHIMKWIHWRTHIHIEIHRIFEFHCSKNHLCTTTEKSSRFNEILHFSNSV